MEINSPSRAKSINNLNNKNYNNNLKNKSPKRSNSPIKYKNESTESVITTPNIKTTSNNLLNGSPNRKNLNKNFSIYPQPKKSGVFSPNKNFGKFNSVSPNKANKMSPYRLGTYKSKDVSYLNSPTKAKQTKPGSRDNLNKKKDRSGNNENEGNENNKNENENANEEGENPEEAEEEEEEEIGNQDEPQIDSEFDKELLAAFREVDEDGSGTISKEEFGNFMRKLGYRPTMVELQEMIDEIDKDKSGQIGFDEFKLIMTKTIKDEFTINSSIEAFAFFDKNKTEKFNKAALLNTLLTKGDNQYSENELNDLLKYVDFDENDEVNYRDLILETFNSFKY